MSKETENNKVSENKALPIGVVVRSADVNIVDSDIATIEALHDLLLDAHGYSLDFVTLKRARELTAKMYKALYQHYAQHLCINQWCVYPTKFKNKIMKRIQRKRTKGWRMPENAKYIGRPTKWGNPFRLTPDGFIQCYSTNRNILDPWIMWSDNQH